MGDDELVRRDIAYFIRGLQAKKHLEHEFVIGTDHDDDLCLESQLDELDRELVSLATLEDERPG